MKTKLDRLEDLILKMRIDAYDPNNPAAQYKLFYQLFIPLSERIVSQLDLLCLIVPHEN